MLEVLAGLMLFVSGASSYTGQMADVARALPPRPDRDQIACHDATWQETELVTLNAGARLHKKLAPHTEAVIAAAASGGHRLFITSGFRSCSEQQRLRSMACGVGEYNLYQKPIDLCLPPTEPAGKSLHNEGLAVDFACAGYGYFASSPCYSWLKANASTYHLNEHRLEPWHWSTTGI